MNKFSMVARCDEFLVNAMNVFLLFFYCFLWGKRDVIGGDEFPPGGQLNGLNKIRKEFCAGECTEIL